MDTVDLLQWPLDGNQTLRRTNLDCEEILLNCEEDPLALYETVLSGLLIVLVFLSISGNCLVNCLFR